MSAYTNPPNYIGDTSTSITIYFTASSTNIVLAWGGHIAERDDWGLDNSAVSISGSPYHMRLISWGPNLPNLGNTDRSMAAAVVVQPGSFGRTWRGARLCTPVAYRVLAIWWPTGWEPQSPLDVPHCAWKAHGEPAAEPLDYARAVAVVRGLNQQSMDHAGSLWYVLVAVENERSRFNSALGLTSQGFADRCELPRP